MLQEIKRFSYSLLVLFVFGSFQKKETDSTLTIQFRAYVHGAPLMLNQKYQNPFGETFVISRFRFYAGKIEPVYTNANFKSRTRSQYHLIDFSDSATTRIELPVTAGILYNGIQFQMGIDSADQNRGAQSGALDPAKGMFWTWNSGYINIKIEGSSPVSTQPAHIFEYHIGGYRSEYNTVWKIKLYSTNDQSFLISKQNKIMIEVGMDLDYLFDGPTPIHISEMPNCMKPGELARKISENFIGTFTGLTISPKP
ncbi:MAG TPA: MbnP family protein [Puia sp.]